MKRLVCVFGMVVALVGFMMVCQAGANLLELELMTSDGQTTGIITSTNGNVSYIGAIGDYSINLTIGTSMPILGSAASPILDISSYDFSPYTTDTLTIKISEIDFTGDGGGIFTMTGNLYSGNMTAAAYYDTSNAPFGTNNPGFSYQIGDTLSFSGTLVMSSQTSGGVTPSNNHPYSLTEVITLTPAASPGFVIANFAGVARVPEPGTLLLLGFGLLGIGLYRMRRKTA